MEGWDGGGRDTTHRHAPVEFDETLGFKDETEEQPHAFAYQGDLMELDYLFSKLPTENADLFAAAVLWNEETDDRWNENIRLSVGEPLTPYRIRIGDKGELQFLVWWSREEGHTAPLMISRSALEDVLPKTYAALEEQFLQSRKRLIYLLERENKDVIGSRKRVVFSLNAAIKTRSEVDLLKEMERQEKERTQSYVDDDKAGMF